MRKFWLKAAAVAALWIGIVLLAQPVRAAEDRPLLDFSRISFAAGVNYAWHAAPFEDSAPVPAFGKEWETGLYAAYNLTPLLSLAGSTVYGFDNKLVETRVGVRIRFGRGD